MLQCSATQDRGIAEIWAAVAQHRAFLGPALVARRATQAEHWFARCFESELVRRGLAHVRVQAAIDALIADVKSGRTSPGRAASSLAALAMPPP